MDNISKLENDHHKAYIELVFILEATSTILQARKVLKVCVVVCFFFFCFVSFNFLWFEGYGKNCLKREGGKKSLTSYLS